MKINQKPSIPKNPTPIMIIGAGGIVKDAHLPAYKIAGFKVLGIFDLNLNKAQALKVEFPEIEIVYSSLEELIEAGKKYNAIFDIAVPANFVIDILKQLPKGSAVLIQKPLGENLEQAKIIQEVCKQKGLISAVNFQLKFAPYMLAAKDLIKKGLIGDIYDFELMVCVYTPWHLWDFLFKLPRVEILYHSIHYLDLLRSFFGNPDKLYVSTRKHPKMLDLSSTRTSMILDYENNLQARIITNHGHEFGLKHQQSYLKIEGTNGAIKIKIGLSLDYPKGMPSIFEYCILTEGEEPEWKELPLEGGWFPEAFIGPMAELQNHILDKNIPLTNSTEDALETMKLVELAYQSSESGGTKFN